MSTSLRVGCLAGRKYAYHCHALLAKISLAGLNETDVSFCQAATEFVLYCRKASEPVHCDSRKEYRACLARMGRPYLLAVSECYFVCLFLVVVVFFKSE